MTDAPLKKGQIVYSAHWGSGRKAASCLRTTRNETLQEFLKGTAKKCTISTWKVASDQTSPCIALVIDGQHRWRGEFDRGSAKKHLAEGTYNADSTAVIASVESEAA